LGIPVYPAGQCSGVFSMRIFGIRHLIVTSKYLVDSGAYLDIDSKRRKVGRFLESPRRQHRGLLRAQRNRANDATQIARITIGSTGTQRQLRSNISSLLASS